MPTENHPAMPEPPLLIYDAAVLGDGYASGRQKRTGVHRVAQELGRQLGRRPGLGFRLHASTGTLAETMAAAGLEGRFLPDSLRCRLASKTIPWQTRLHRAVGRLAAKSGTLPLLARKPLAATLRLLDALGRRNPEAGAPEQAAAYLSPYFGFPRWTAGQGMRRGIVVCDLIPVKHPELFGDGYAERFRTGILDTIEAGDWVFCISESTRRDWLEFRPEFPPERAVVIPLAASESFFPCRDPERQRQVRRQYGIPEEGDYLLSLCTLEPRKNLDGLVRAFVAVARRRPELSGLKLVLTGGKGWKDERIQATLEAAGELRSRIILTGFVPDQDLAPLYSGALGFGYLSFYEGFGLPPLEAMQCGCPVLCSDRTSLPEVVGDAGLLVDPAREEAVAAALERLATDAALRERLAAQGLERARLFSWERAAEIIAQHLCGKGIP